MVHDTILGWIQQVKDCKSRIEKYNWKMDKLYSWRDNDENDLCDDCKKMNENYDVFGDFGVEVVGMGVHPRDCDDDLLDHIVHRVLNRTEFDDWECECYSIFIEWLRKDYKIDRYIGKIDWNENRRDVLDKRIVSFVGDKVFQEQK